MQLKKGQKAPLFVTHDIWGNIIDLKLIGDKKILLCFFRYAECSVCQLRVSEIMGAKTRFSEQGIKVIAVFQSPAESLRLTIADKPHFDFAVIADPERVLYDLYFVKPSWIKLFKTINLSGVKRIFKSIRAGFKPGGKVEGLFHQIPADFIIDSNKDILAAKYGNNVVDHIPLSEILAEQNGYSQR
ncbi:peroxiredoxin-like family protein [uncultured Imperialibacter sp.]|uniref:peroxiredoxin-like family protein n=1 Tax=uncultured Imperialibacter sp. TaxID=1672639 RepID=UPI0030DA40E0|tara:strand:+ start:11604 stop:12161 length:558 start_codon:yes stop_codon:yes gene_type:complete